MYTFLQQRHPLNKLLMEKLMKRLRTDGVSVKFQNTQKIIQYISACYPRYEGEDSLKLDE